MPPREADTGMTMTPRKPLTNAGAAATRILLGPPTSRHDFFPRTHIHTNALSILLRFFSRTQLQRQFLMSYLFIHSILVDSQPLLRMHIPCCRPRLCMYSPAKTSTQPCLVYLCSFSTSFRILSERIIIPISLSGSALQDSVQ